MPAWRPELAELFPDRPEVQSEPEYHSWFLRLCGILGDPVGAKRASLAAKARGTPLKDNPFTYKPAFKVSPTAEDIRLLHSLLVATWGEIPSVLDPTAGGGSIPYEAIRYGLPTTANDLNPVAASILRAGIAIPAQYGRSLEPALRLWGTKLVDRVAARLSEFFPSSTQNELVLNYLFARTVACPRTGKLIPLSPNWWLSKGSENVAVRLVTEREGQQLDAPEFEIVSGEVLDFDPTAGTIAGGDAVSPWDGLTVDGDYIKAEAQAGRMGSILYAVAVRCKGKRQFRAASVVDLMSLNRAALDLEDRLPGWLADGIIPDEEIDTTSNYDRGHRLYGIRRWRDMFSPRQLLVHGTFVEEFGRIIPEVRAALSPGEADSILALLALMQGKALDYNAGAVRWDPTRAQLSHVFEKHNFSFKWAFGEFEGARELYPWCLDQMIGAYEGIVGLLELTAGTLFGPSSPHAVPGPITVMSSTGGDLQTISSGSTALVCIDPPYYDNVMYAELADYFYVWEKRTLGLVWPELFSEAVCDKKNEAVANSARFAEAGKRKKELANLDYEAKMTAIFSECHRVLRDEGDLTVMFTHKRAEAWDTLGMSLMEAGFAIESSWPVNTESETSSHSAGTNSATSTIMLVCRKRLDSVAGSVFFEDVEGEVRAAARDALAKFSAFGIEGVDLLLSTYGPALSVISSQWPVYSSEADPLTGKSRLLRPEEALDAARGELVRLQRQRLIGRAAQLDPITDFVLLAWEIFKAREFPFDEARRLALAVGGLDVDELVRAKVIDKKSGTVVLTPPSKRVRRQADLEVGLPGIYLDAQSFPVIIDALHTAMHLAAEDGPTAAKAWLDRVGLTGDQRFQAALQGLVNAMPRTKTKDKWAVPEAEWLDAVCFYFPDVTVPKARTAEEPAEQAQLDFGV